MKYILYSKDSGGNLPPPTFRLTNTALVQGFITTYWNYCKSLQFSFLPPDSPAYSLFSTLLTRVTLTPRACMLSRFSCAQLFVTLWTVAREAPLSMGFPRQECWIGLLYSLPGDLPDPRIKPGSPTLQVDSLPSEPSTTFSVTKQIIYICFSSPY